MMHNRLLREYGKLVVNEFTVKYVPNKPYDIFINQCTPHMRNKYQCETYSLPERYTVVTAFEGVQISPASSIDFLPKSQSLSRS